ncbi:unnamed protein product [Rhizopus microsporus]
MSGLEAWEARRKQWTTPNADVNVEEYIQELNKKQYQDLEDPKKRLGIYKQLIQQHQTFLILFHYNLLFLFLSLDGKKTGHGQKE